MQQQSVFVGTQIAENNRPEQEAQTAGAGGGAGAGAGREFRTLVLQLEDDEWDDELRQIVAKYGESAVPLPRRHRPSRIKRHGLMNGGKTIYTLVYDEPQWPIDHSFRTVEEALVQHDLFLLRGEGMRVAGSKEIYRISPEVAREYTTACCIPPIEEHSA